MRKFLQFTLVIMLILGLSGLAFAGSGTLTSAASASGAGMNSYKPSSGVTISYYTAPNSFCHTALNSGSAGATGGYEYGMLSSSSALQRKDSSASGYTATGCSSATALGSGFAAY